MCIRGPRTHRERIKWEHRKLLWLSIFFLFHFQWIIRCVYGFFFLICCSSPVYFNDSFFFFSSDCMNSSGLCDILWDWEPFRLLIKRRHTKYYIVEKLTTHEKQAKEKIKDDIRDRMRQLTTQEEWKRPYTWFVWTTEKMRWHFWAGNDEQRAWRPMINGIFKFFNYLPLKWFS